MDLLGVSSYGSDSKSGFYIRRRSASRTHVITTRAGSAMAPESFPIPLLFLAAALA